MAAQRSNSGDKAMISIDTTWQRFDNPVLSACSTSLSWCRVYCYMPHVIRTPDEYRMYYIGRSDASRHITGLIHFSIGLATSEDGVNWRPYGETPILSVEDVRWGGFSLQTPHVIWDEQEQRYKLWFISTTEYVTDARSGCIELTQRLGYATSQDGIHWDVHPEPIFESGRRPCVLKEGPGQYRMWMNSRPSRNAPWGTLYHNIYEFRSADGIHWTRSDEPAIRSGEKHDLRGCIYPFVCREGDRYLMWYGGYPKDGGIFQIYFAESDDGTTWRTYESRPAFPVSDDPGRFDSRYTSTPCVLIEPDRCLLYYSAVDLSPTYTDPTSQERRKKTQGSFYQHIGVAVSQR